MAEQRLRRWAIGLGGLALTALGLSGCATFVDDVTSHDFKFGSLFSHPNPMVVLAESHDGDARARAFRALREPLAHGGTQEQQDVVVKALVAGASNEHQPVCRLAAIDTLGHFKDPRAVQGLKEAFLNSASYQNAEVRTLIACRSLLSLGETKSPEAIGFLAQAVNEPGVPETQATVDRRQTLDVRLAAARALGNFNQREATTALVQVLQKERDVALRDRATESLRLATGENLPPDATAWNAYLSHEGDRATAASNQPGFFQRIVFWQK